MKLDFDFYIVHNTSVTWSISLPSFNSVSKSYNIYRTNILGNNATFMASSLFLTSLHSNWCPLVIDHYFPHSYQPSDIWDPIRHSIMFFLLKSEVSLTHMSKLLKMFPSNQFHAFWTDGQVLGKQLSYFFCTKFLHLSDFVSLEQITGQVQFKGEVSSTSQFHSIHFMVSLI